MDCKQGNGWHPLILGAARIPSIGTLVIGVSDVDNPHGDLRIVSVENATHGTVALNPDGTIRFAPDADYFGAAQFTWGH